MQTIKEKIPEAHSQLTKLIRKVKFRLLPLIVLMFALAMLDRSNVGFVKHYLEIDAGIGASAYALGAGIFFIGYALFEVPSNLILHKVGARLWLSRIMVTWGLVSIAMIFVHDQTSFYILRFLLGAAEAGFSPGVILFLTYWFPKTYRGQAYGWYYLGVPIALMMGGPFSGWLLDSSDTFGFRNWQWMFIVQGALTVLVGIIAFFVLVSKPDHAKWLTQQEKRLLNQALAKDQALQERTENSTNQRVFTDWRVWRFVFIYFTIQMSVYGVLFYLPSKLAALLNMHVGLTVGYYSAIPWICTLLLLPIITRIADKKANWNSMAILMLSCAVAGIGLSTQMTQIFPFMLMISLAVVGFIVVQPLFWNLPTQYLAGRAAAMGTALIGSVGNLGGFVAPNLKNWADQMWNNDIAGLTVLATVGFMGVIALILLKREHQTAGKRLSKEILNDG
ncbi:MFS transporter [Parapedobacter koreensis]|uniref:Sugar phosphate permease n=1 Tax=Parapedobacter koreensis TaxID=332977 RepID=A0A1H7UL29_9SPHI|nr:MFS transporter [Parapedobacter koreensis]SEL97651.1 Sugar phosphate permease [Parapedobacter koreensis]